jgi:hypothetical protein
MQTWPWIESLKVVASLLPDQRDAAFVFRRTDFAGQGVTDFFKAGKIPEIRKFLALLRLDGLDGATFAFQKNARAIRLFLKRQSASVVTQPGELLDKIGFAQALEGREPLDFRVGQTHLSRPATTGRATLAFEEDGHGR